MNIFKKLLLLSGLIAVTGMQAELLVVKQVTEEGISEIVPLSDEDITAHGKDISKVLLKYQWPMCIASDLTEEEKDELLTPDVPCAEEKFIQKKIRSLGPKFNNYRVVFIPTTIYELIVMSDSHIFSQIPEHIYYKPFKKDDKDSEYTRTIKPFFHQKRMTINKQVTTKIIERCRKLIIVDNEISISDSTLEAIILCSKQNYPVYSKKHIVFNNKLIKEVISLDRKARSKNKALLLRGGSAKKATTSLTKEKKEEIITTTLHSRSLIKKDETEKPPKPLNPLSNLYSVSFGNSFFAGFKHDIGACAAYFFNVRANNSNEPISYRLVLMIDKKEYISNTRRSLFIIPPIPTELGLSSSNEFFHPRTTIALDFSKYTHNTISTEAQKIDGILYNSYKYKHSLNKENPLFIDRNPYLNAALFSELIICNGVIVTDGSREEKRRAEELFYNQKKLLLFYKQLYFMSRMSDFLASVEGMPLKSKL